MPICAGHTHGTALFSLLVLNRREGYIFNNEI